MVVAQIDIESHQQEKLARVTDKGLVEALSGLGSIFDDQFNEDYVLDVSVDSYAGTPKEVLRVLFSCDAREHTKMAEIAVRNLNETFVERGYKIVRGQMKSPFGDVAYFQRVNDESKQA